ncbi:MAG: thiamine pyrophosphate-dependent dehydrogenase E1 component subunit alpha [Parachlamydiales bacterium]|jgi:pyruvate dehydrogenase E1 component alpha subunit
MMETEKKLNLKLFYALLRIRLVEERIAQEYPKQQMRCPVHLSIGQEAIAVGVCNNLNREDYLFSTHRAHAHYLAKGGSLKKLIAEIYGKASGCSKGYGGSMHLIDLERGILGTTPIVAGSLPVAVGAAFKIALKAEKKIVAVFFGEGSTEEGVWSECLNFASLKKLPVLFVCENNFFSVYSPLEVRQPAVRNRVAIARAHGLLAKKADGNLLKEVYLEAKKAVNYLRSGKGPVYLEFDTYRFREHCGPHADDHLGYRKPEEVLFWQEKCPLKLFQAKLMERGFLNEKQFLEMKLEIEEEIEEAFLFAQKAPYPEPVLPAGEEKLYV